MVQSILTRLPDADLEVFAVWIPAIRSDNYAATDNARKLLPDPRVRHFWDGSQAFGEAVAPVLSIRSKMAWDVYLVFGGDASWGEQPPGPDSWQHQLLGEDPELLLTEEGLERLIRDVME